MSVNTKEFEIVVFGATSFVGKILCNYLCNEYREPNLRWAMAARSSAKLNELKTELGENAKAVPLIVADSADAESLAQLCDRCGKPRGFVFYWRGTRCNWALGRL